MPSGDSNLATTSALPLQQTNAIPLTNGAADAAVNYFPGGTYEVSAQYAGDGLYATGTSAPVSLTVTPEPSAIAPLVHYYHIDYAKSVAHSGIATNGQQLPFSSQWVFDADPTGVNSQTSGLATGAVTFTDGATSEQVLIGSAGIASTRIPGLALGAHSVTASYSGDNSFNASAAGPVTFTVVQGIPRVDLDPEEQHEVLNGVPIPSGSNLPVAIAIGAAGGGAPPTGTVSVTLGGG